MRHALLFLIAVSIALTLSLPAPNRLHAEPPPDPKYKLVLQAPPTTSVNSVTVSPDGALVATASGEGGVRLYDAKSGALLRALGDVGDRSVVFSPDSKTLTAAGFHMDKLVALYDVQTGKRLRTFAGQTEWEADATAISPDGKLLASTATDKQVLVWEIATGKLRLQLKDQPFRLASLAFSPDGATLAGGGGDKSVKLWDIATGKLRRTFEGQSDWISTLAFSPDGKRIASGSCDWGLHRGHDWPRPPLRGVERCEWRVWDAESGKLLRSLKSTGKLLSLAFAPDGNALICGIGKEVRLFELFPDSRQSRVVTTHDADVTSVAFTPDGVSVLSAGHDNTVTAARTATGDIQWQAPGDHEQVNAVALSNDAALLVTGSSDGRFARGLLPAGAKHAGPGAVRLWDARTGGLLRRLGDPGDQILAVALTPDAKRVAAAGGAPDAGKGVVRAFDAATGTPLWSAVDHAKEVLAVAFAPDGSRLATGAADGVVHLRDAGTGRILQTLTGHAGGAASLAFAPDGNTLYCAQAHGGTRAWDLSTGRLLHTHHVTNSHMVGFTIDRQTNSVTLSADGKTLADCASSENDEYVDAVRLWDTATGTLKRDFAPENIHGRPAVLSPDGAILATGGKSVQLWDVRTGKPLRNLFGHLKRTQSIVFSADRKLVVEGGSYGTTNIWQTATGRLLVTLFTFRDTQSGAPAPTDDWLAYTPDPFYHGSPNIDRYLAWRVGDDLQTPATLAPMFHHPDRVAAALSSTPNPSNP